MIAEYGCTSSPILMYQTRAMHAFPLAEAKSPYPTMTGDLIQETLKQGQRSPADFSDRGEVHAIQEQGMHLFGASRQRRHRPQAIKGE
ncbi:hypothetical protein FGW37_03555 [Streptomyces rectiverticillatus]|uniref:hypothetical protein n=1 Tax=Streptomyces rectiverticillatus TaxID=173860 RepID=UPI0015C2C306|nr:hypothetical protein [Streptomyces rectiverticillatus]QLE70807.1 hypothetical protein FGW37_03555 [Streptomyces rectiverticillatus]